MESSTRIFVQFPLLVEYLVIRTTGKNIFLAVQIDGHIFILINGAYDTDLFRYGHAHQEIQQVELLGVAGLEVGNLRLQVGDVDPDAVSVAFLEYAVLVLHL